MRARQNRGLNTGCDLALWATSQQNPNLPGALHAPEPQQYAPVRRPQPTVIPIRETPVHAAAMGLHPGRTFYPVNPRRAA